MNRFRIIALVVILAVLTGVGAFGIYELLNPPFTDQEIKASFVDTWEVAAWSTMALLVLLTAAVVVSLALSFHSTKPVRRLSTLAVFAAVVVGSLICSNHVVLTNRVTQITGQTFGDFYGLF